MRDPRHWLGLASGLLGLVLLIGLRAAVADDTAQHLITTLSPDAISISESFYTGQSVYDKEGNEIGDINDVLLDTNGKVTAVIVGVGGVLGGGEKAKKDLERRLVLNMPEERLELAPGFQFDRAKRRWVPAAARLINRDAEDK